MMTSKSAGSPAFLPPELCQAKHGDVSGKAADIWSMGVSLYCLKYGRLPFRRDNVLDMYEAIRTEEIQIPREDEDENFVDLITKILDKNCETRLTLREIRVSCYSPTSKCRVLNQAEPSLGYERRQGSSAFRRRELLRCGGDAEFSGGQPRIYTKDGPPYLRGKGFSSLKPYLVAYLLRPGLGESNQ